MRENREMGKGEDRERRNRKEGEKRRGNIEEEG